MMRTYLFAASLLGISCLALGCGGSAPAPQEPESAAADEEAPMAASGEEAGHDLDVGMEFAGEDEDQDADDESEEDHEPPPTQTYSPANRIEEDSKAIGESDASQ